MVAISRELADSSPDTYLLALGGGLVVLAMRLNEVGRNTAARAAMDEAMAIEQSVGEEMRATKDQQRQFRYWNLYLAVMSGRGSVLWATEPADALEAMKRVVEISRGMVETLGEEYLPNLARALTDLGSRIINFNGDATDSDLADALPLLAEATTLFRRLAEVNPAAYREGLAQSLSGLGVQLVKTSRKEEALDHCQEAVDIYRQLATEDPDAYRPNFGAALDNFSGTLALTGKYQLALTIATEGAGMFRQLARDDPEDHRRDLAESLNNLGLAAI